MADQATEAATPASEQDQSQSTTGAPEGTSAPESQEEQFSSFRLDDVPEEHRSYVEQAYRQLQGDYTRKTQTLAEQRKQAEADMAFMQSLRNPETLGEALAQIREAYGEQFDEALGNSGYEFIDDQQEDDTEPEPFLTRAEWEQYQTQQQQQAAQSQQEQYIAAADQHLGQEITRINAQLKEQGRPELTDRQEKLIVKNALVDTQPGQLPDVQTAYDEFAGVLDEGLKSWAGSKHPGATTGGGRTATQVPDLDNMSRAERDAEMTRMWREADQQGGP